MLELQDDGQPCLRSGAQGQVVEAFTLDITTSGNTFDQDDPGPGVAMHLRRISYRLEDGEKSGKIRDDKGNTIGKFKLK